MKTVLMTMAAILTTSVVATAGTNFNSLIVENSKAQNELHSQIKSTVDDVKLAVQEGSKTVSIASETVHVKTNKQFLTFAKEKKYYKASDSKSEKRLAEEFQNLE
jgi:hypothetical protein